MVDDVWTIMPTIHVRARLLHPGYDCSHLQGSLPRLARALGCGLEQAAEVASMYPYMLLDDLPCLATQVRLLRGECSKHPRWHQELASLSPAQLAALASENVSAWRVAAWRVNYLLFVGGEALEGSLLDVLSMSTSAWLTLWPRSDDWFCWR
jgi:hypothetical protein